MRTQSFLSTEVTQVLVKSMVISKLDYCEHFPSQALDPKYPIQHHAGIKTLELAHKTKNWPQVVKMLIEPNSESSSH